MDEGPQSMMALYKLMAKVAGAVAIVSGLRPATAAAAEIVDADDLAQAPGRAGIDILERQVVAHARMGDPDACSALNAMLHFGRVAGKEFDGGLDARQASGRPVSTEPTTLPDVARVLAPRAGMLLSPAAGLRRLYAKLDPDQQVVVHCRSGVWAAATATVMREFGLQDVKACEPSGLGDAAMLNQPATHEVFLNLGALVVRWTALTRRLGDVGTEPARMRAVR